MIYALYNPLARNCVKIRKVHRFVKIIEKEFKDEVVVLKNILDITDSEAFLKEHKDEDKIVIIGGDGTLNHLINTFNFDKASLKNIYLLQAGTGNDFARSLNKKEKVINISENLKNLPTFIIDEKEHKFLNGIGIGLDGLICKFMFEERLKKVPKSFFSSAIKAFLRHEAFTLKIKLDNEEKIIENVKLCSIMNSNYYGGGMKISPNSNRENKHLDIIIIKDITKKQLLLNFRKVYKGQHLNLPWVSVFKANEITIKDNTEYIQMDGELIIDGKILKAIKK